MTTQTIDVETGSLLIIDPIHLPVELVNTLITKGQGVIIPLDIDGTYTITAHPEGPIIID